MRGQVFVAASAIATLDPSLRIGAYDLFQASPMCGMHLYQHGMDLTLISQWLCHAQLDTTLIYAHADTEQKRHAIAKATPSDSPLKKKLNSEKFTVTDEETLKLLYGLK